MEYLSLVWEHIKHFPSQVYDFKNIRCAETSIYTGLLVNGLVSGVYFLRTGSIKCFRYGFYSFVATSIISFEICQYKLIKRLREKDRKIEDSPINKH